MKKYWFVYRNNKRRLVGGLIPIAWEGYAALGATAAVHGASMLALIILLRPIADTQGLLPVGLIGGFTALIVYSLLPHVVKGRIDQDHSASDYVGGVLIGGQQ